jgi:hypothetical protein
MAQGWVMTLLAQRRALVVTVMLVLVLFVVAVVRLLLVAQMAHTGPVFHWEWVMLSN